MKLSATSTLLLALLGCNQVYGLDSTRLPEQDASPVGCPPLGRAPKFLPAPRQVVQQECTDYHFNGDGSFATAVCSYVMYAARRDEMLVEQVIIPPPFMRYTAPRPSPTQRRIYVGRTVTTPTFSAAIATLDETSPGTWRETGTIPIPWTRAHFISTVFRGPTGDRMILSNFNANEMSEYEQEGNTWVKRGDPHPRPTSYDGADVFSVTTDGLRAVYPSLDGRHMMYVHRPDLESWFGEPQPLEGAPVVEAAQLTDDCMRLYYEGLDSIFFSQQE